MKMIIEIDHSDCSSSKKQHKMEKTWQVNMERLGLMQEKMSCPPRILSRSAGRSSCCIFKVPQSLVEVNGQCYHPHIVSIGPYHHGNPQMEMIQEHKWRYLGALVDRTQKFKGLRLQDYLEAIHPLEAEARECYSTAIDYKSDEFVEMLVVDGCFVIELFRKFGELVPFEPDDPLLSMSWIYSFFLRDLIRLENQIPFFVLQALFDLTQVSSSGQDQTQMGPSLSTLLLQFFNNVFQRPDESVDKFQHVKGKHILDFLRSTFIPKGHNEPKPGSFTNTHVIQCISKLRRAGIQLRPSKDESFLVIKFGHGVIEMPKIPIDDFMSAFLLNCVAYEQCHKGCSKHITTYATLLDCLINTAKDVEYLCDKNILENYFGTDMEVAKFINNMGKDVVFDIDMCYLTELFNEVNHYYRNHWHVHYASFKYTYFSTPWSFISALAAFVLLVLTIAQTFYTVMSYVNPP